MTIRRSFIVGFATVCSLLIVPTFGQMSNSSANKGQNAATAAAGKAVAKAEGDVGKIQSDMTKIQARLRAQILAKPEWAAVVNAKKAAEQNLDTVKRTILATVRNKDDYKSMVKDRETARQAMTDANSDPNSPEAQKAASEFIKTSFAIKQTEMAALKDDPRYDEANKQVEAADAKMRELDDQVKQAEKDDQEYQAADKQLETAKNALQTARTQLAQANQQERAQREQQAKARQQQQGGGSGTGLFR